MSRERALHQLRLAEERCLECGGCTNVCPVLQEEGLGISHVARHVLEGTADGDVLATVLRCGLCGLCSADCPAGVDAHHVMISAREAFAERGLLPYEGCEGVHVDLDATVFSAYRDAFGISYDDLIPASYDTIFFPGCVLATYSPEITRAAYTWLAGQDMQVALSLHCCGSPLESLGLASRARRLRAHIADEFADAGVRRVVTVCPGCHAKLAGALGGIEVVALPDLMSAAGVAHSGDEVLTVHDSCGDRGGLFGGAVRRVLGGHPLVEMEHHGKHTICCGSGGMVSAVDPDLYAERGRRRLNEFERTGADRLVTACVTCVYALSRQMPRGKAVNYLELVFGTSIDWEAVRANQERMWYGEQGERAMEHLSSARCFTGWTVEQAELVSAGPMGQVAVVADEHACAAGAGVGQ